VKNSVPTQHTRHAGDTIATGQVPEFVGDIIGSLGDIVPFVLDVTITLV
jgi:hypothetical protein